MLLNQKSSIITSRIPARTDLMVYVMENGSFTTCWAIEDMDRTLKDGEEYLLVAFDDGIELDED